MGRRRGRKKGKILAWIVFLAAVAAMIVIAYVLHSERQRDSRRAETPVRRTVTKEAPGETSRARRGAATAPAPAPREIPFPRRRVVIIVDDIGHDLAPVKQLLAIDGALTFAVLPDGARSTESARLIHESGREVLLHLPLEPRLRKGANAGAMAIRTDMTDDQIRHLVGRDIRQVPHARGANSHMGSLFTEREDRMTVLLGALKAKGLFFVDSRTTADSRARDAAGTVGIPFAQRNAFIDGVPDEGKLLETIRRLTEAADDGQPPVVIGHPYPATIRSLQRVVPLLRKEGIQVVSASAAVRRVDAGTTASR